MSSIRRQTKNKPIDPPFWAWPLFLLSLWQILLRAQNPGLMSDDSGEMIAASYRLGLPHPPGYPLFCLLGRLISFIPLGTVAFRFNLLSGAAAFLCLLMVADTCRKLMVLENNFFQPRPLFLEILLAFLVGSLFFNRSFFAQAMTAKGLVYMLSLLIISSLVWLRTGSALAGKGNHPATKNFILFFLFFLGFGNHWQTQILLVPFVAVWFLQEMKAGSLKSIPVYLSFGLVALSTYLYLPLRSVLKVSPDWGAPSNLTRFLWVVTRKLSSETESPVRGLGHYLTWGNEYARLMRDYWWPGFWLLGLAGVLYLGTCNRKLFYSFLVLYLTVLYAILTVARDEVLFLLNVYLVSIHGLFAVFAFLGLVFLFTQLAKWNRRALLAFGLVLFFMMGGWGVYAVQKEDKSRYSLAEDFGLNVMKGLPKNTLLLADGDHYVMPIWYQQYVENLRPDLIFQPSVFLYHNWGWAQLANRFPDLKPSLYSSPLFVGRLKAITGSSLKHPFFYSLERDYLQPVLDQVPGQWVPRGLAYEWMAATPNAPAVLEKVFSNARSERFRNLVDNPELAQEVDSSSRQIYRYYALQYYLTAQFIEKLSAPSLKTPK